MMLLATSQYLYFTFIYRYPVISIRHCHPFLRTYLDIECIQLHYLSIIHRFSYLVDTWSQNDILPSTFKMHNSPLIYFGYNEVTILTLDNLFILMSIFIIFSESVDSYQFIIVS